MKVVIVKYNTGNTCSVAFALRRIGIDAIITDDAAAIQTADKVILPGVGAAAPAMQYLNDTGLAVTIQQLKQPVLGICLGMQLLCRWSEEGDTRCLGIFEQDVKKFAPGAVKVPQMGWNNIFRLKTALFANVPENEFVYHVHSYNAGESSDTIAMADYGIAYSAALNKGNFYAVQFHPEKSGQIGQRIIENFIKL